MQVSFSSDLHFSLYSLVCHNFTFLFHNYDFLSHNLLAFYIRFGLVCQFLLFISVFNVVISTWSQCCHLKLYLTNFFLSCVRKCVHTDCECLLVRNLQCVVLALRVPQLSRARRPLLQELLKRVVQRKLLLSEQQTGLWARDERIRDAVFRHLGPVRKSCSLNERRNTSSTISYLTLNTISPVTLWSDSNLLIL